MADNPRPQLPSEHAAKAARAVGDAERPKHPSPAPGSGARALPDTKAWPDRRIGAIAGQQRTLVSHDQLRQLGVGPRAVSRAVARGRLHRRHRGVYSLVERSALPPLAAEQAAVMACGRDAYLSHHSAAAVWEFRPASRGPLEVTVVGRDVHPRDGIRTHRARTIDPRDTRTYERIPITSPARTLLDIASDLSDRELEKAFDEAIATEIMTLPAAKAMLLANPRRPGWSRLHDLARVDRDSTVTHSEAEDRFLALVRQAALPDPEVNARIGRWTVDFLWRAERVVIEIDGDRYHSSRWARERDHRKDAELQQAGLLVIRISARRLWRAPEQVLVQVVTALTQRHAA